MRYACTRTSKGLKFFFLPSLILDKILTKTKILTNNQFLPYSINLADINNVRIPPKNPPKNLSQKIPSINFFKKLLQKIPKTSPPQIENIQSKNSKRENKRLFCTHKIYICMHTYYDMHKMYRYAYMIWTCDMNT